MSPWIWLIIAVVFGIIEVTNFAFFALFVAAGAIGAAIAAALGAGVLAESITLGAVTVGGILLVRRPLLNAVQPHGRRQLISGVAGLVGHEGIVVRAVHGVHHPGLVRARGEEWPAISYDPEAHEVGAVVHIIEIERTRLVVTSA